MKQFSYVIKDEIGLHARPAGLLAKEAKKYQSTVTFSCKGKSAAASKLMAIMGMGVKHGDNVEVTIEGADEDTAAAELQKFFRENPAYVPWGRAVLPVPTLYILLRSSPPAYRS